MADWRLDQKTEETPQDSDLALMVRGINTFKTTFKKIKEFIIGSEDMGTTSTNVTGAIKEINSKVGNIDVITDGDAATQLANKIDKSKIKNDCNTLESGYVADARQLKYLMDLITKINNTQNYTLDLNTEKSIVTKYNETTLNTPYTQGLITAGIGTCITFMDGELQIAFPYMINMICMRYNKGSWVKVTV